MKGEKKSSKLWSSQLWTQFKQLRMEAWKSQDFNGTSTGWEEMLNVYNFTCPRAITYTKRIFV